MLEHGIYVSNSADRPVIRGNHSWGNRANGIHMNGDASQGGDGMISGALVERNVIYDNGAGGGSGINCDGVHEQRRSGTTCSTTTTPAASRSTASTPPPARPNNLVVNNTILVAADGRWAFNIRDGSTGNTVVQQHPLQRALVPRRDDRRRRQPAGLHVATTTW